MKTEMLTSNHSSKTLERSWKNWILKRDKHRRNSCAKYKYNSKNRNKTCDEKQNNVQHKTKTTIPFPEELILRINNYDPPELLKISVT